MSSNDTIEIELFVGDNDSSKSVGTVYLSTKRNSGEVQISVADQAGTQVGDEVVLSVP